MYENGLTEENGEVGALADLKAGGHREAANKLHGFC